MTINWKVIGRWVAMEALVITVIALFSTYVSEGWGMSATIAVCAAMIATKFEPRPWAGKLMDEWRCAACDLRVRATNPAWVAMIRNTHICHEAR